MYLGRSVAVVIPIHNEENFVAGTIRSVPDFVDAIILVDDGSSDLTLQAIEQAWHSKVHLIRHSENRGVGAATISGYQAAIALGVDIVAVMDGDGQMDPSDLPALLDSIIIDGVDYAKGNRFLHSSLKNMPRFRYIGNRIFSMLTQYVLGIGLPLDAQCGYTAITSRVLRSLDLERLYPRYGFLNALLFSLMEINIKIGSVPVRTIYGKEISDINPFVTVPVILGIIVRGYLQRMEIRTTKTQREKEIFKARF